MKSTQHLTASDLMSGDWVLAEYCTQDIRPASVSALIDTGSINLVFQNGMCLGTNLNRHRVEPIPLTPEILEKNGFHYTNEHTLKGADTYILRLEQRGFDLKVTIKLNDYFAIDSYDDRVYRLMEISTGKWYVHHLQHALKLCGIAKEIVI